MNECGEYAAANTCDMACTRGILQSRRSKKKGQLILSYGEVGSQRALGCNIGEGRTYIRDSFDGFYDEGRVAGRPV